MIRRDVHGRPASWYTRLYLCGMWLRRDKEAFEGVAHTLSVARRRQAQGDRRPTPLTRVTRKVVEVNRSGMTSWSVRPRRKQSRARVFYVHGGGYVHPLTSDYWRLVRALSSVPADVVVPAYPLAPDATVDDVLPMLLELLDSHRRSDPALPTVLMGDSAGGALVLAMAGVLRDRDRSDSATGSAGVVSVVGLSPWLDATLDEAEVADLEPSDPMLAETGLRAAGRWWSGPHRPDEPLVSPVQADLRGLPPIDVYIGERDILRPGVEELVDRADRDGADLHVHESPAMFHVWMTRAIPEGRRTRRDLVALLRERIRSA
jgi:monoterpene epsilon-lactone hydrolase